MYHDLLVRDGKARDTSTSLGFSPKVIEAIELMRDKLASSYSPDNVVFVEGGSVQSNQQIAHSQADVLLNPCNHQRMSVDTAILQVCKDNDITIGLSLDTVLNIMGYRRIRTLVNYRQLIKLCNKIGNRIVLTSRSRDEFGARSPQQLIVFGTFLGMTRDQAKWSIREVPEYLIEKKKKNAGRTKEEGEVE